MYLLALLVAVKLSSVSMQITLRKACRVMERKDIQAVGISASK